MNFRGIQFNSLHLTIRKEPYEVRPVKPICYHCSVDSVVYSLKNREWFYKKDNGF